MHAPLLAKAYHQCNTAFETNVHGTAQVLKTFIGLLAQLSMHVITQSHKQPTEGLLARRRSGRTAVAYDCVSYC